MSDDAFDPYYRWLGIPPKDQPPDHYRLLSVERFEAHADVIAEAADRQMAHLRTRQAGPHAALAARLLNEVAAARVCLLSSEKKQAYDERLAKMFHVKHNAMFHVKHFGVAADSVALAPAATSDASEHASHARGRGLRRGILAAIVAGGFLAGWALNHFWNASKQAERTAQAEPATDIPSPTESKQRPAALGNSNSVGAAVEISDASLGARRLHESSREPEPPSISARQAASTGSAVNASFAEQPLVTQPRAPAPRSEKPVARADSGLNVPTPEVATSSRSDRPASATGESTTGQTATGQTATGQTATGQTATAESSTGESAIPHERASTASQLEVARFALGDEPLLDLAISFDGRRLAALNAKNQLIVIDLTVGSEIQRFSAADLLVERFALVPDGRFLLASGVVEHTGAAQLRTYRATEAIELTAFPLSQGQCGALAVSANGATLAVGHRQGAVTLHATRNPSESVTLHARQRSAAVTTLAFSADHQYLVFGDESGQAHIALVAARKPNVQQHLSTHSAALRSLGLSLQGEVLMTADAAGLICVWRDWRGRDPAQLQRRIETTWGPLARAALSPSGKLIATTRPDGQINLWRTESGQALTALAGHTAAVTALAFLPEGERLVSASRDGTVRVWRDPLASAATASTGAETGQGSRVDPRPAPASRGASLRPASTAAQAPRTPRLPLPTGGELIAAQSSFERTFGEARADATQNVARMNLANRLLQRVDAEALSPAERYVLLNEARRLAIEAGNVRLAHVAHDQLAQSFEIEVAESLVQLGVELSKTVDTAAEKLAAARAALDAVSTAIAADKPETARRLCALAIETVDASSRAAIQQRLQAALRQIDLAERLLQQVQSAKLDARRDDLQPEERLTLGQFLCFNRGDWPSGLEQFALAEQGEWSAVAALDWSEPDDPRQQLALAERWMALAAKQSTTTTSQQAARSNEDSGLEPVRLLLSKAAALYWLEQALSELDPEPSQQARRLWSQLKLEKPAFSRAFPPR